MKQCLMLHQVGAWKRVGCMCSLRAAHCPASISWPGQPCLTALAQRGVWQHLALLVWIHSWNIEAAWARNVRAPGLSLVHMLI